MQKILNILFFVMSAISYGQVTVLTDVNTKEPKQNEPVVLTIVQEVAVMASTEAVQIFGGYGYTKDFPVEKFYRDSKLCTIGEGTSEIQKLVIAREILK